MDGLWTVSGRCPRIRVTAHVRNQWSPGRPPGYGSAASRDSLWVTERKSSVDKRYELYCLTDRRFYDSPDRAAGGDTGGAARREA